MRYNRRDTTSEARRILRLAWPIMLTSLNWTLMHMIDVAVVGHYGTAELAALAASRILTFLAIVIGFSGLTGVLVYAARADGGGRLAETGDIFRSGLILGLAVGLLTMTVLGSWAFELLGLAGVEPALRQPGAAVVQAMALAFPSQFVLAASSYFLEGISRPRRVMTVNLLMLPVNALLAWAWVGGHLGLPALGAVGAAYATASVSAAGALMMLVLIWLLPRAGARGVRDWSAAALRRALAGVPRLAWFGLMPAIGACARARRLRLADGAFDPARHWPRPAPSRRCCRSTISPSPCRWASARRRGCASAMRSAPASARRPGRAR